MRLIEKTNLISSLPNRLTSFHIINARKICRDLILAVPAEVTEFAAIHQQSVLVDALILELYWRISGLVATGKVPMSDRFCCG